MPDKILRAKLIRLAHAYPKLRADLLPLLAKRAFRLPQVVIDHVDPHFLAEAGKVWDELQEQERLMVALHAKAAASKAKVKQAMDAESRAADARGDEDWDGWEFQRAIDFYDAVEDAFDTTGSSSARANVEEGYQLLGEALAKADRRSYSY